MKLTPRLTLTFIIYAAALLTVVGVLAYSSGRNSLRSATISELSAISIEKQAALNQWVAEKQKDIASISTDPTIIADAFNILTASNHLEAQTAYDTFVAEIQPHVAIGEFFVLMLIDPQTGEVIAATDPGEEGKFQEDRLFFIKGKAGPFVQNVYFSTTLQGPAMTASAPLIGPDGQLLGVLAGRINLEEMNSIINRRSGLRETDDAFLVNTSNLFVTQPYLVIDPAVLKIGVHTEAVNRCLKKTSGTIEADDYRGVPSVIAYRWLPERELCMIVKIDQQEAYESARAFGGTIAGFSALALLIAAGLAVVLSRSLSQPIRALQSSAIRFREGDLDMRLPETSQDELGELAREFNQMAASLSEKDNQLRAYSFELEKRVVERTAELKRSEEKFRLFVTASSDVVYRMSRDWTEMRQLDGKNFIADTKNPSHTWLQEYIHPDDQSHVLAVINAAIQTRSIFELEHRVRQVDGMWGWTFSRAIPIYDAQGEIVEWFGAASDITERKKVEGALTASQQLLQNIIDNSTTLIYALDLEGKFLVLNHRLEALFGVSREELIAKTRAAILPPEVAELHRANDLQVIEQGLPVTFEEENEEADGKHVYLSVKFPLLDAQGGVYGTGGISTDITERKQAEETLRESEVKFSAAFQSTPLALVITTMDGKFIEVNRAFCELVGYSNAEIIGKTAVDIELLPAESREKLLAVLKNTGGTISNFEVQFRVRDGSLRDILYSVETISFRGVLHRLSTGLDITERRQTEQTLRESEDSLKKSQAVAHIGHWTWDTRTNIVYWSDEMKRIFGINPEDFDGSLDQVIQNAIHPNDRQRILAMNEAVTKDGKPQSTEYRVVLKDGSIRHIWAEPGESVRDEHGNIIQLSGITQDITERKKAEAALRESEDKFKYIFDHSVIAKSITLPDGTIAVNKAFCEMLGYSEDELINKKWQEITHPDDIEFSSKASGKLLNGEKDSTRFIKRYLHKNGSVVWTDVNTSLRRDAQGKPVYFMTALVDITERKQAEEQIKDLLVFNEKVINNSPIGILTYKLSGACISANENAAAIIGTSVEKLEAQNFRTIESWKESGLYDLVEKAITRRTPVTADIHHISTFGNDLWLTAYAVIFKAKEDEHVLLTITDITERKLAELDLQESEELFRLATEASPNSMIMAGRDGRISFANQTATALFGYTREELIGFPIESLIPERFRAAHPVFREGFFADAHPRPMGKGRDLFALCKDGLEVPVEIGLSPVATRDGLFALATITDIRERKQSENILATSEIRYRRLFESAKDGILVLDAETGMIVDVNPFLLELLGFSREEFLEKKIWELGFFKDIAANREAFAELLRKEYIRFENLPIETSAGLRIEVEFVSYVYEMKDKKFIQCNIRNITDRVKAEIEIRRVNVELEGRVGLRTQQLEAANKELEAFSYSVSHDLRAPLRSIDGFSQALLEDFGDQLPDEGHGHLKRVRASAQRMAELIDDMLNLSRVTRAPLEPGYVDLSRLAQNIASELQRSDPARAVEFSIAPHLETDGDARLLQIVLENLMNNAWKFTSKKGGARIEFGSKLENGEAIYFVRDNGAGFDMIYAGKLFGAFQRLHAMTEYPGTGIGLATVQRVIHRHGGRVWAEGLVDQGATFYFTL